MSTAICLQSARGIEKPIRGRAVGDHRADDCEDRNPGKGQGQERSGLPARITPRRLGTDLTTAQPPEVWGSLRISERKFWDGEGA